jgi:hypothetical protein
MYLQKHNQALAWYVAGTAFSQLSRRVKIVSSVFGRLQGGRLEKSNIIDALYICYINAVEVQ